LEVLLCKNYDVFVYIYNERFGHFRGVLAFARFIAPIVGGMMWVSLNPAAPFVMVGIMELLLVPVYYVGMKRYQQALLARESSYQRFWKDWTWLSQSCVEE
jgi:hypothetical protein